jgi:signal transduction histidine kinase/CheY-like chemotaxis protein
VRLPHPAVCLVDGYNVQASVDATRHLIVAHEITTSATTARNSPPWRTRVAKQPAVRIGDRSLGATSTSEHVDISRTHFHPDEASRYVSVCAGAYAIVGGLLSFAGWAADIPRLTDWWGTGITIKANTALGICAVGVAITIAASSRRMLPLVRTLGFLAAVLGALTLYEHITNSDLGIDTLLFDEPPGVAGTAAPGRMGPPAAASFLALGAALVFLRDGTRIRVLSVALPIAVIALATLSMIGFLYGAHEMYTIPRLTGIAVQTATMFLALGVGALVLQDDREPAKTLFEHSTAGILARRILAAAFIVPLALGWLRVEGQRLQLYDFAFGSALRTLVEIAILTALSWWVVQAMRMRDRQQQRAETERQAGEQRLRIVLDASAVPFAILAPVRDSSEAIVDFSWSYLNAAAARALRRDIRELTGRRISEVLPAMWRQPGLFDRYVAVVLREEVHDFELHSDADGLDGWYQVVASPLDGNVAVWFADVTMRKRHEIDLRDADRRKDEFLAILAHELRNPLAPIRQVAALFTKPTLTEDQRQWCMEVIERQVQHMSVLLEDLLDVSRITRGTLELRRQPTELSVLVESAVETARPFIDSKRHKLTIGLPPAPVHLNVDPVRTSQVIANLLNNAAKYTDAGGLIRLTALIRDNDFVLTVTDNGIGIPKQELATIFQMFSQVQSARERAEGGLGIGLALTKGLVELHGGTVTAESAGVGAGSSFRIEVPNARAVTSSHEVTGATESMPVLSRRILVADDNVDAGDALAMLLRSDGHDVKLVRDGDEALKVFASFNPDVVLLDLGMPQVSGYEVARRLRADDSAVLLIAITGWGQSADRAKSAAAGFDHHLTKPVDYRELAKALAPDVRRPRLSEGP